MNPKSTPKPRRSAKPKRVKTTSPVPALILAAEKGDSAQVLSLINSGADVNEATPPTHPRYYGADPLIVAARHGHREVVELLLAKGAKVTSRSAYGSAIQQAIDYGHANVVRILLKVGAKELGYSLFNAVEQNNVAILKAVSEAGIRFDRYRGFRTKESLLEKAIQRRRHEVVDFILTSGIKLTGGELVECAARGTPELADKLISQGATASLPNRKGRYPLSTASYWGNKAVAEILLVNGADLRATDMRGWSCLDWAEYGKQKAIIKWLKAVARERHVKIPKQRVLKIPGFNIPD